MKKIFFLLTLTILLNGCVESIALLGSTAGGASSGKLIQSSLNSAVSYGIKQKTGKTPLGHALAYADEKNPQKKKETCISFVEKTRSEFCTVLKKQISLTNVAIKKKALLIVKKTPKIENKNEVESISQPEKIVILKDKKLSNILIKSNESPRTLAIKHQAKKKKISDNKFLNPNLFRR
mgnify:CR=1 FL=1